MPAGLDAEILQLLLAQAPLEIGARVGARRGMALHEHHVGTVGMVRALPEVVVADLVHDRRGLKRRDVATRLGGLAVGPHDHRGGVPAQRAQDLAFEFEIARVSRLLLDRNGVDVRRVRRVRRLDAGLVGLVDGLAQQELGALGAVTFDDDIDGLFPFPGLLGIDIGRQCLTHFLYPQGSRPRGEQTFLPRAAQRRRSWTASQVCRPLQCRITASDRLTGLVMPSYFPSYMDTAAQIYCPVACACRAAKQRSTR